MKEIPIIYAPYYFLGSCKNIAEVQAVFDKIVFTEVIIKEIGGKAPLHLMFHDRDGKSLIVEFIDGKVNFYEHPIFCNSPTMEIHLAKLAEYKKNIKPEQKNEGWIIISKLIDHSYNDERFLLLNYMNDTVGESFDVKTSVANCFRVLGRVNISAHENDNGMTGEGASSNMWDIVRDHKNLKIYYRSYINQSIQMLDINKLLAAPSQKIYLAAGNWYNETTK
jgi:choloylglycine hydrolase